MSRLKGWYCSSLFTLLAVLVLGGTARAASITGLIVFDTDSSGNRAVTRAWNTNGGDGIYNIYMTDTTFGGAFVNADDDANTSLNYALTPGAYQFYMYGEATASDPYYGLNLFFDGDNTNPGISAFAQANTDPADAPAYPAISANGAANTPDLLNNGGQSGANTLVYNDGSVIVTLTDYWFSNANVRSENRVQAFDETAGGGLDLTGAFAVTVTAVPEPSTASLLALGLVGIAAMRRRTAL
jgi:hypothetical protein